jgi:hypothetical protein
LGRAVASPWYSGAQALTKAVGGEIKRLFAAAEETTALELATANFSIARHLYAAPSSSLIDKLVAQSIEQMTLARLPPDVEFGDTGKTAAQQLAEIKQRKWPSVDPFDARLEHMGEREIKTFLDRRDMLGEVAAQEWLKKRIERERTVK